MNSYELARKAALAAVNKKADRVVLLNLQGLTGIADYFVICSGEVDVHVKAIVDEIRSELGDQAKPWHVEGYSHLSWVLMDYVDFVVHIFRKDTRDYYNLEKLWADARIETFAPPA